MANPKPIVVTLDNMDDKQLKQAVDRLRKAGLDVTDVLEFTGQVLGNWSTGDWKSLREVEGVVDVAESRDISIGPPDSDIQ